MLTKVILHHFKLWKRSCFVLMVLSGIFSFFFLFSDTNPRAFVLKPDFWLKEQNGFRHLTTVADNAYSCPSFASHQSTTRDVVISSLAIFNDQARMSGHFAPDSYRFLESFFNTHSAAKVVLFVDERLQKDESLQDLFDSFYVEVQWVSVTFPMIAYRFELYKQYLAANKENIGRVMIVDLRDSYFLSDPFPYISTSSVSLHAVGCQGDWGFGKPGWTYGWVQKFFGKNVALPLANDNYPILNAGSIFGGIDQVLGFLNILVDTIVKSEVGLEKAIFGVDQAALNVAYYSGIFHKKGIHIQLLNEDNSPLTLHIRCYGAYIDCNKKIRSSRGCPIVFMHGYDRHDDLLTFVEEKSPLPNGWSPSKAGDTILKGTSTPIDQRVC
ncbi:hypothetical protein RCL1_005522 [Eukaryota sp. TZLM3-RCL]